MEWSKNISTVREPPSLDGLVRAFDDRGGVPKTGEIWRCYSDSCSQLVLVVGTSRSATVLDTVPVSPDIELSDGCTTQLEIVEPLRHPLAAWQSLRAELPISVFDYRIAVVSDADMKKVRENHNFDSSPINILDERHQLKNLLSNRMRHLATSEQ